ITGFVLLYRLPHEGWRDAANVPLQDAKRGIRILRAQSARYRIDPARIGVLGFSAGGHLAATLSLRAEVEAYAPVDATDRESAHPSLAALLYPVITMLPPFAHEASREMLLGDHATLAQRAAYSCERLVKRDTPPMFLAAAADARAPDATRLLQRRAKQRGCVSCGGVGGGGGQTPPFFPGSKTRSQCLRRF